MDPQQVGWTRAWYSLTVTVCRPAFAGLFQRIPSPSDPSAARKASAQSVRFIVILHDQYGPRPRGTPTRDRPSFSLRPGGGLHKTDGPAFSP